MKQTLTMIAAVLAAGLLSACAGEGEGAGTFTLAMIVEGIDEMADSMDTDVTVNEAYLHLEAAELAMPTEEGGEEEDDGHAHTAGEGHDHGHEIGGDEAAASDSGTVRLEPGLIDLVNDPDPMSGELDLASDVFALAGEYTTLTVSAGPGEIEGEEHELTFLLEGEIECVGGGNPETLLIELESDLDGLAALDVDLDVENLESSELEFAFHADELLAGIDLCEIATLAGVTDEGEIEISQHAAEEAEEMMEEDLHDALHEAIESLETTLGDAFHVGEHEHE